MRSRWRRPGGPGTGRTCRAPGCRSSTHGASCPESAGTTAAASVTATYLWRRTAQIYGLDRNSSRPRTISPSSSARRAASRRVATSSRVRIAETWWSTVRVDTTSRSAISGVGEPGGEQGEDVDLALGEPGRVLPGGPQPAPRDPRRAELPQAGPDQPSGRRRTQPVEQVERLHAGHRAAAGGELERPFVGVADLAASRRRPAARRRRGPRPLRRAPVEPLDRPPAPAQVAEQLAPVRARAGRWVRSISNRICSSASSTSPASQAPRRGRGRPERAADRLPLLSARSQARRASSAARSSPRRASSRPSGGRVSRVSWSGSEEAETSRSSRVCASSQCPGRAAAGRGAPPGCAGGRAGRGRRRTGALVDPGRQLVVAVQLVGGLGEVGVRAGGVLVMRQVERQPQAPAQVLQPGVDVPQVDPRAARCSCGTARPGHGARPGGQRLRLEQPGQRLLLPVGQGLHRAEVGLRIRERLDVAGRLEHRHRALGLADGLGRPAGHERGAGQHDAGTALGHPVAQRLPQLSARRLA